MNPTLDEFCEQEIIRPLRAAGKSEEHIKKTVEDYKIAWAPFYNQWQHKASPVDDSQFRDSTRDEEPFDP